MEYEVYENMHTREQVAEEDAQDYALDQLGIKIEPKGKNGEYTKEQIEFVLEFTDWYFSGEWVKKKIREYIEDDPAAILEDARYEYELSKRLLEE